MVEPHLMQSGPWESSPEDRHLCCECAKIDLENIFHSDTGRIVMKGGIEVANFGRRLEAKSTCYLCRFFWASRLPTTESLVAIPSGSFRCSLVTPDCQAGKYPETSEQKISSFLRLCLGILEKWDSGVSRDTIGLWPMIVLWRARGLWNSAGNMATFSASLSSQDMADANSTEGLWIPLSTFQFYVAG
jgi:hypothetical protein